MSTKQTILITLHSRLLTEDEADELRAFVAGQRPKVHLIMANWPWLEVRGISEQVAQQIVERVRALVPRCSVEGLNSNTRPQGTRQGARVTSSARASWPPLSVSPPARAERRPKPIEVK